MPDDQPAVPTSTGSPGRCCCCLALTITTTARVRDNGGVRILVEVKGFRRRPATRRRGAEATRADRERYLSSGLQPVDCRFCHVTVTVKKLGPGTLRCNGVPRRRSAARISPRSARPAVTPRAPGLPELTDSIEHAVAEGYLSNDEDSTVASAPLASRRRDLLFGPPLRDNRRRSTSCRSEVDKQSADESSYSSDGCDKAAATARVNPLGAVS